MFWKPLKVKMRDGVLFELSHAFVNDNYIELSWDWYRFGLGIKYYTGDTRRFLDLYFGWAEFNIWF